MKSAFLIILLIRNKKNIQSKLSENDFSVISNDTSEET